MRLLPIVVLVCASSRLAAAADPEPVEERRLVVALFDSAQRHDDVASDDPIHQMIEMPLNHLGLVVRRWDIRKGPPPAAWMESPRAILTQFEYVEEELDWLWPWLEEHGTRPGVRVVHLDEFGPLAPLANDPEAKRLTRWLARFGLEYDATWVGGPVGVQVHARVPEAIGFEGRPMQGVCHRGPVDGGADNRVWLETTAWSEKGVSRCAVVTGPWGGIALLPWSGVPGTTNGDRRWFLDPFAFLSEALGMRGVPAPHPSVLNGRRMFMLHVDGDGFESLSTVESGAYAAKVFLDEFVRGYDLPMTLSIIVASLSGDLDPDEPTDRMLLARQIFREPNVELGSHTVLHPLRWDRNSYWYERMKRFDHDPVREVVDSIAFIDRHLAPPDKPCRMMLWSGQCNPPEEAVRAATEAGCGNINGGVFRWDAASDSVGFVSPWGTFVGDAFQVYAGAANENEFEGFYDTMPGAFAHIDTTIERCGSPRILKPANVYCHFYSAERPARLAVLHRLVRRWGIEEETAPVFASRYYEAVRDATRGARVLRAGPDRWILRDLGACRTVRLDAEPRGVDFAASRGVVGARRIDGQLYVALSAPDAELVLADDPEPRPHLEQANHDVEQVERDQRGLAWVANGFGGRVAVVAGLPPEAETSVTIGGETSTPRTDADGRLTLTWRQDAPLRVVVSLP